MGGATTGRPGPAPRVQAALAELRGRGERVTRVRRAVLEVLDGTTEHLAAGEIASRAEASAPGVHRASVYRALATLGELGLVTHTHLGGAATVHHLSVGEPRRTTPHVHLQCTSCLKVLDVEAELLQPVADRLADDVGFALEPQHAALLGTCADCR